MFSVFVPSESALKKATIEDIAALPDSAVWIDLFNPSPVEDKAVERLAGIAIPTREDMQEIEISSRLYIENGARYMTATLMCHSDSEMPKTTAVTFKLKQADDVRMSIARQRPLGEEAWVLRTAKRLGLEFTLRPPGRPRKRKNE